MRRWLHQPDGDLDAITPPLLLLMSPLPRPPALAPNPWPFMALLESVSLGEYPVSRKFFLLIVRIKMVTPLISTRIRASLTARVLRARVCKRKLLSLTPDCRDSLGVSV